MIRLTITLGCLALALGFYAFGLSAPALWSIALGGIFEAMFWWRAVTGPKWR